MTVQTENKWPWIIVLALILLASCALATAIASMKFTPGAFAEAWVVSQGVDEANRHDAEMHQIEESLADAYAQEKTKNIPVRERNATIAHGIAVLSMAGVSVVAFVLAAGASIVYLFSFWERSQIVNLGNGYRLINKQIILDTKTGRIVANNVPALESRGRIEIEKTAIIAQANADMQSRPGRIVEVVND